MPTAPSTPPRTPPKTSNWHQVYLHTDCASIKSIKPVAAEVKDAAPSKGFLVVTDPISTGANLAHYALNVNKYPVVRINSNELSPVLRKFVPKGLTLRYNAVFDEQDTLAETVSLLKEVERKLQLPCIGVIAGSEPGVTLADALSEAIGVTTNGTALSACRRDKYLMGERIREAGLRAVVQRKINSFEDVDSFIAELKALSQRSRAQHSDEFTDAAEEFKAILKPLDSAGSDGVYLCHNRAELKAAYDKVVGSDNLFGKQNTACLVQEFLGGTEYVVDTVSKNGVHKVAAVWEYEKHRCNGADFVYYGNRLRDCRRPRIQQLIQYQFKVLDALGIKNGPGHGEVKFFRNEPVLIEVGNRPHGLEGLFLPIATGCLGYNQCEMAIDAYLNPRKFEAFPTVPSMHNTGAIVTLVNMAGGRVKGFSKRDTIIDLASFHSLDVFVNQGTTVPLTKDVMSIPGVCCLMHEDHATVEKDIMTIRGLEADGIFDLEH